MSDGLLNLSWLGVIAVTLVLTHITIASVTIFLHRHQAHRALELHPLVSHFFRFWLWLTTGMVTKQWVATHRKHHAFCETEQDPHSPQVLGLKKVLWQGTELYQAEASKQETLDTYGQGTPDDWLERRIYSRLPYLGISLMLIADILMFGPIGITVWAVQMIWIPFFAAGVINGVGHYWGYRNYEPADASRNIFPWGILIGGEELHNNHHTFASSAKLSSRWWEFDIGWFYIRLLSLIGLARVKRVAPRPVLAPAKSRIDMDTVKAVLQNRFAVMAQYSRAVIKRVNNEELSRASGRQRGLLKRARKLLVRDTSLMSEGHRQRLSQVLSHNASLNTVYQYKQQLQELWKRSSHNPERLLAQLQEWCHRAEASDIKALEDFSRHLRGYTLKSAKL